MKRWIGILLLISCALFMVGFRLGYSPVEDYEKTWYGWYEVSDADGVFADLKGIRQDCIIPASIDAAFRGIDDGDFPVYDSDHYVEPLLALRVNYSKEKLSILGGTAGGQELETDRMTLTPWRVLGTENGIWGEGTVTSPAGSLTIRLFCMPADQPASWDTLKDNRGTLKLSYEELLPDHYEDTYLPYTERSGGWNPDVEAYFMSAAKPLNADAVRVRWAKDCDLDGKVVQFVRTDNSADFSQLVMDSAVTTLRDFRILKLTLDQIDEQGNPFFAEETVYQCRSFDQTDLMMVQLSFHGDLPEYGIRYEDVHGREYFYTLEISGEDGTPILAGETISEWS